MAASFSLFWEDKRIGPQLEDRITSRAAAGLGDDGVGMEDVAGGGDGGGRKETDVKAPPLEPLRPKNEARLNSLPHPQFVVINFEDRNIHENIFSHKTKPSGLFL
ncbi:hypothetical protein Fot_37323 [Forsythia ovata]|uniref:Uncharacterized protein n=1 Tax=Forsythia ovata TaxID=205694 RepID=A0ABD1RYN0_9LAMI